jgi:Rieske Fe-S protein
VLDTLDYAAFIGLSPDSNRTYVATGDSGQGITHGVVAGMLLTNLILDRRSEWVEVYEPARKPPGSTPNFVTATASAIANFAEWVAPGEIASAEALKPGEGGLMRVGLSKMAVCRDLEGILHEHSAACTHMGCLVHWNSFEQCWDCTCHGSQFAADGSVLNGPATQPLAATGAAETEPSHREHADSE